MSGPVASKLSIVCRVSGGYLHRYCHKKQHLNAQLQPVSTSPTQVHCITSHEVAFYIGRGQLIQNSSSCLNDMQQIMIELDGTASEEDSGKGPGGFSKQPQERQPDMVLSDTSETQRGLIIVNYHFYRNDFLQHRKAALPLNLQIHSFPITTNTTTTPPLFI